MATQSGNVTEYQQNKAMSEKYYEQQYTEDDIDKDHLHHGSDEETHEENEHEAIQVRKVDKYFI